MHTLFTRAGLRLVEVSVAQLYPQQAAANHHGWVPRDDLVKKIGELDLGFVDEAEIQVYAKETRNNPEHWPKSGNGRRFIMLPLRLDPKTGEELNYFGPYPDCGTSGYELGLWRHAEIEHFPLTGKHPIALRHSLLSTLVAKAL